LTLAYYSGLLITGTNSDRTGGTWTNLPAGWKFLETDTQNYYYWNGSSWLAVAGPSATVTHTNKTMDAASNTFVNVSVSPDIMRTGYYQGTGTPVAANCSGVIMGQATNIAVGSGGTSGVVRGAAGATRFRYSTGATNNSLCGTRFNAVSFLERSQDFQLQSKIVISATTTVRFFFGTTSSTSAPASSADPLANLSGVGYWYDSGVDGNLHIIQNNGGASSDITTLANIMTMDANPHTYHLRAVDGSTKFQYQLDGGALTNINTAIPAQTTGMGFMWYIECTAGSATRTFDVYYGWVKFV
jgi:hypothetical protein